jgi:hypothetical protein
MRFPHCWTICQLSNRQLVSRDAMEPMPKRFPPFVFSREHRHPDCGDQDSRAGRPCPLFCLSSQKLFGFGVSPSPGSVGLLVWIRGEHGWIYGQRP